MIAFAAFDRSSGSNHEFVDISDRAGGSGTIRERQPGEAAAALVSLRGVVANRWGLNRWGATPIGLVLHPLKRYPKEKSLTEENFASRAE